VGGKSPSRISKLKALGIISVPPVLVSLVSSVELGQAMV